MKKKFTSRKFIACAAGIITGIAVIINGSTVEGITAVISSVVAYLIAEGYIDAKAVKSAAEIAGNVAENVKDEA